MTDMNDNFSGEATPFNIFSRRSDRDKNINIKS